MALVDDKQAIFNNIGALRTLNNGFPNLLKNGNSYDSVNNKDEAIKFLIDVVIALVGVEELKSIVSQFLTTKLDVLESSVRACLKSTLNDKINLGVAPSIPSKLKTGYDVKIPNIDFYHLLKTDPVSQEGSLLYSDNTAGINSEDCNTFIYESLQDGDEHKWGSQTTSSDIIGVSFNNQLLNVKIDDTFSTGKTLRDLNNTYLDSIRLYETDKLINLIFDKMFGVMSSKSKTPSELKSEAELDAVIDNIKNAADSVVIDDSYFTFNNDQIRVIEEKSVNRAKGVAVLKDCGNYESTISVSELKTATEPIINAVGYVDLKKTVDNALDDLTDIATVDTGDTDKQAAKSWFFKNILNETINALVASVLTPKVIIAFSFNTEISDDMDGKKFVEENKVIIKTIVCSCKEMMYDLLLNVILKEIIRLTAQQATNIAKEAAKNRVLTTLSLVGVPQDVLAIIRRV